MLLEDRSESAKEVLPWSTWATIVTFWIVDQQKTHETLALNIRAYASVLKWYCECIGHNELILLSNTLLQDIDYMYRF